MEFRILRFTGGSFSSGSEKDLFQYRENESASWKNFPVVPVENLMDFNKEDSSESDEWRPVEDENSNYIKKFDIPNMLRWKRIEADLTVSELADMVGIDMLTIYDLENNRKSLLSLDDRVFYSIWNILKLNIKDVVACAEGRK